MLTIKIVNYNVFIGIGIVLNFEEKIYGITICNLFIGYWKKR